MSEKQGKLKRKNGKGQKEEYAELKGIMGNAEDYHVYHMKRADYMAAWFLGFVVSMVVIYAFFRSLPLMLAGGAVCGMFIPKYYQQYKRESRVKQLRIQFKDLLESLSASYSAGRNTPDAFADALSDMESVYGTGADIVKEIQIICAGLANNYQIEVLLLDFAARSGLDDVTSFANVFEVCNRQGSDMKRIVADTRNIINDKIEIEMEIETMLSGNKNELNIMMVMPVIIVLSLSSMGSGTIVSNDLVNLVVKVICLGIFGIAYVIGRKITDVKI